MKTVKIEEIVRQKDPELKQVVEQLARGEVREAVHNLERQGRVHEIQGHDERIAAIAKEYARSSENTLVISPDNRSRAEINGRIHAELQRGGLVSKEENHAGGSILEIIRSSSTPLPGRTRAKSRSKWLKEDTTVSLWRARVTMPSLLTQVRLSKVTARNCR